MISFSDIINNGGNARVSMIVILIVELYIKGIKLISLTSPINFSFEVLTSMAQKPKIITVCSVSVCVPEPSDFLIFNIQVKFSIF